MRTRAYSLGLRWNKTFNLHDVGVALAQRLIVKDPVLYNISTNVAKYAITKVTMLGTAGKFLFKTMPASASPFRFSQIPAPLMATYFLFKTAFGASFPSRAPS